MSGKRARQGDAGAVAPKKAKKSRRTDYHSSDSSTEEQDTTAARSVRFAPVDLNDSDADDADEGEGEEGEGDDLESEETGASSASDSEASSGLEPSDSARRKRKRNDPEAFATSMSKILGSKLTSSKRADPVLSRSKSVANAGHEVADAKLEAKAKRKLRDDKRAELDRGRVRDVLGVETTKASDDGDAETNAAAATMEEEKRLRKTAQRGVVKLFNAVRAAQVKSEQAAKEAKTSGAIGHDRRQKQINEMSKQGFLDFIAGGAKNKSGAGSIEEA